jgi:hypothetical protein
LYAIWAVFTPASVAADVGDAAEEEGAALGDGGPWLGALAISVA